MKAVNIPEGYQQVMPYLIVKEATKFLEFMQQVFDAQEKFKTMRDENTIRHAELAIGNSTIMYCDSTTDYQSQPASLFIYVDDCDARYHEAIKAGAASIMDPATMEYGRSAGIKDPFGNTWWITSVV